MGRLPKHSKALKQTERRSVLVPIVPPSSDEIEKIRLKCFYHKDYAYPDSGAFRQEFEHQWGNFVIFADRSDRDSTHAELRSYFNEIERNARRLNELLSQRNCDAMLMLCKARCDLVNPAIIDAPSPALDDLENKLKSLAQDAEKAHELLAGFGSGRKSKHSASLRVLVQCMCDLHYTLTGRTPSVTNDAYADGTATKGALISLITLSAHHTDTIDSNNLSPGIVAEHIKTCKHQFQGNTNKG